MNGIVKSAFIVSKPLQILMAYSIAEQLGLWENAHLVIVDEFDGADETWKRICRRKNRSINFTTVFSKDKRSALDLCRSEGINSIFLDSDVGPKNYLRLIGAKFSIGGLCLHVFEEGIGTYRNDIYPSFKRKIFELMGVGAVFGGCSLTDDIFVCNVEEYRRKMPLKIAVKAIGIRKGIRETIERDSEFWEDIFRYEGIKGRSGGKSVLYISNWEIDNEFLSKFSLLTGDKYVKPHPHIRDAPRYEHGVIIGQGTPAEIVILDLAKKYKEVEVFHHGSSCEKYISGSNIRFETIR